jgi:hypothetical protein
VQLWFARGLGSAGWIGWYRDEVIEKLAHNWLLGQTQAERNVAADAFLLSVFDSAPQVPVGQIQVRTSLRRCLG